MTVAKNGSVKPVYEFVQTEEASSDTFAEITLHVDGKPTRILIMVCGSSEFCVCVDNIGVGSHSHVKHLDIVSTRALAEAMAIAEFEQPSEVK